MTPDEVRFMKTIQIPTTSNPFIVNINNNAYQYRAGETAEVPDEVAAAIEDALELEPKPERYLSKLAQLANGTISEITASDLQGIETIAYYAFGQHYSLKSIEIPKSVTSIGKLAFYACNLLESIRFGDNSKLGSVGESAFEWCTSLKSVYLPETPPTLVDVNAFLHVKTDCVFYCKTQASLEAYKAAVNWSTLAGTYSFVVEA